jgi:hypothetical protein
MTFNETYVKCLKHAGPNQRLVVLQFPLSKTAEQSPKQISILYTKNLTSLY